MGAQQHEAHPSERALAIWLADRASRAASGLEDLFIEECVSAFPVDKISEPLEATHHVIHVFTGPEQQGFPSRRPRLFSAGLSKSSMLWLGPSTPTEIQEHFSSLFHSTMELSGDIFLVDSAENVTKLVEQRWQRRRAKPSRSHGVGRKYQWVGLKQSKKGP